MYYKLTAACTLAAALLLGALPASAASFASAQITSPAVANAQLKAIADAEPLWKDEFVARWDDGATAQPHLLAFDPARTYFAVTDLDGNGRLELLFRHADLPQGASGPVPPALTGISTHFGMAVYEIGTDGRLARLPEAENGYGAPDLTGLYALHQVNADDTRPYNIRTRMIYEEDDGRWHYTVAYQQFMIADGIVKVNLLAEEYGYYSVYDDRIEKTSTGASIYDGIPAHTEMRPEDFVQSEFYQDFDRIYTPHSAVRWIRGDELNREPREALPASWQGFVYGVMDGKG